ncbi:hypothetical protein EB796_011092 [Bugula neritina]|uniref:Uncharacterized protein n=1 Tax=Bugula neritina TaxID=10212 RepID=A0A7J7JW23_BUGNE|nr:hypothetical protein EB796_011092 [Bugula neritina]
MLIRNSLNNYYLKICTEEPESKQVLQKYFEDVSVKISNNRVRQFIAQTPSKQEYDELVNTTSATHTGNRLSISPFQKPEPTLIEVKVLPNQSAKEMYKLMVTHLKKRYMMSPLLSLSNPMITCSAARLMVSIKTHLLNDGVVVAASIADESESFQSEETLTTNMVLVRASAGLSVAKKLMQKHSGKFQSQLAPDACTVVGNKDKFMKYRASVELYSPPKVWDTHISDSSKYSHIEVKKLKHMSKEEMYQLLEIHLESYDVVPAKLEQCYDTKNHLYRYDMRPAEITKLLEVEQYLDSDDKNSKLAITPRSTGFHVLVESAKRDKKCRLTEKKLRAAFGLNGKFLTEITALQRISEYVYEMQMATCSAAGLLVAVGNHELKDGVSVEVSFRGGDEDDSSSSDTETGSDTAEEVPIPVERRDDNLMTKIVKKPEASVNLLLSNLGEDIDVETLHYWVKTVFHEWPSSILQSMDGEKAIVKVNVDSNQKIDQTLEALSQPHFLLYDQRVSVKRLSSTKCVEVICSTNKPGATISEDDIEAYFTNPHHVNNAKPFVEILKSKILDQPAFILTYSDSRDVENVLQRKFYKYSAWEFEVLEFWSEIGLTNRTNLISSYDEVDTPLQKPVLFINDVKRDEMATLKLHVKDIAQVSEDEVETCQFLQQTSSTVELAYKDPKVTQSVHQQKSSPTFRGRQLKMELVLPEFKGHHDRHRVRVSGLTEELDPEKLRFYLSALSNNSVTQMSFNKEQTRAIAEFEEPLSDNSLLTRCKRIPIQRLPWPQG